MGLAFDQELSRSALLRVPVLARSAYNAMSIDLLHMGKNLVVPQFEISPGEPKNNSAS